MNKYLYNDIVKVACRYRQSNPNATCEGAAIYALELLEDRINYDFDEEEYNGLLDDIFMGNVA